MSAAAKSLLETGASGSFFIRIASTLRKCGDSKALNEGKQIHQQIVRAGYGGDVYLGNLLVHMYGKCESLGDARAAFDGIAQKNVFSWNMIIAAYARNGHVQEALEFYRMMDVKPNRVTFVTLLSACSKLDLGNLAEVKAIHARILGSGVESDVVVETALVNMYGKFGQVDFARRLFDKMNSRNAISWNAMIAAYAQNGHYKEALGLYHNMLSQGSDRPGKVTFLLVLSACSNMEALEQGRAIHACLVASGFESDPDVANALLNLYIKCGRLEDAEDVFAKLKGCRNVISWTAMITAYVQHGRNGEALEQYWKMKEQGEQPDDVTWLSVLGACSTLDELAAIHAEIISCGYECDTAIGTSLVSMYGKCGSLDNARLVFDRTPQRNVMLWNSMLAAYAQCNCGNAALELFHRMELEGQVPDRISFVTAIDACASLAAFTKGKSIHARVIATGYNSNLVLGNAILNMYGKCGKLDTARSLFDDMPCRDKFSWTAMISAYAHHGHDNESLELFEEMELDGVRPNEVTFLSILFACSHAGLKDKGQHYFVLMVGEHGIRPAAEHYRCIIDLFGRAGGLDDAEDLVRNMPVDAGVVGWITLLGACKTQGDVERAEYAAERVFAVDPTNSPAYMLLSNMYIEAGRWKDLESLKKQRASSSPYSLSCEPSGDSNTLKYIVKKPLSQS